MCFITPSLGGGGAERVLASVASHLAGECSVSIINFADSPSFYPLHPSIRVRRLGNSSSRIPGTPLMNAFLRFVRCVRIMSRERPDVVISFMDIASVNALLANVIARRPLILSEHCNPKDSLLRPVQKLLRRRLYGSAAAIVSPTRAGLEMLKELGVGLPDIQRVIWNPLAPEVAPRQDVLLCERSNVLLFVGRLSAEKQVDHLIDIFAAADLPGWELHIVGDGPERARLEEYARSTVPVPSSVRFLGWQDDLGPLYRDARLLGLTSRTEGLGNVLLEAMANGCVCISYDCQVGPSELIRQNVDGILVPAQDRGAFTRALVSMATDAERYGRLQREAVKLRERVDLAHIGSQWKATVEQVLGARRQAVQQKNTDIHRGVRACRL
jgi:GalNAc-alpha-(1->4)-GalNAc-alpha-(1->3)-diNAcBac-PP-undecaprenol alpha-1,4-N-acetyl-D-galactosaminyltransferase